MIAYDMLGRVFRRGQLSQLGRHLSWKTPAPWASQLSLPSSNPLGGLSDALVTYYLHQFWHAKELLFGDVQPGDVVR